MQLSSLTIYHALPSGVHVCAASICTGGCGVINVGEGVRGQVTDRPGTHRQARLSIVWHRALRTLVLIDARHPVRWCIAACSVLAGAHATSNKTYLSEYIYIYVCHLRSIIYTQFA